MIKSYIQQHLKTFKSFYPMKKTVKTYIWKSRVKKYIRKVYCLQNYHHFSFNSSISSKVMDLSQQLFTQVLLLTELLWTGEASSLVTHSVLPFSMLLSDIRDGNKSIVTGTTNFEKCNRFLDRISLDVAWKFWFCSIHLKMVWNK